VYACAAANPSPRATYRNGLNRVAGSSQIDGGHAIRMSALGHWRKSIYLTTCRTFIAPGARGITIE
jgi:hypothetical protein